MSESGEPLPLPFTRPFDLADLGKAGAERKIDAGPEDLVRLAEWLDVEAARRFSARIQLSRQGADRYLYEAELEAGLVQACVVTLGPVEVVHRLAVSRELHVLPRQRHRAPEEEKGGLLALAADGGDGPEELETSRYDLSLPLLEELSLALDPYPRAPGVAFEVPEALKPVKENPFAALARLKDKS